jgi:hypothetical protein
MLMTSYKLSQENGNVYNRLSHKLTLSNWQDRIVVRPNNDTLYSSAWINLSDSQEPLVLTIPGVEDRYYSFQFLDMDTNVVKILGSRNKHYGHFVLASQDWQGTLPDDSQLLTFEHENYWLLARYLVKGQQDLPNIYAIQDKIALEPLSHFIARSTDTKQSH